MHRRETRDAADGEEEGEVAAAPKKKTRSVIPPAHVHPNRLRQCRFEKRGCTNPRCEYLHSDMARRKACRYGSGCRDPLCSLRHEGGGRIRCRDGAACANGLCLLDHRVDVEASVAPPAAAASGPTLEEPRRVQKKPHEPSFLQFKAIQSISQTPDVLRVLGTQQKGLGRRIAEKERFLARLDADALKAATLKAFQSLRERAEVVRARIDEMRTIQADSAEYVRGLMASQDAKGLLPVPILRMLWREAGKIRGALPILAVRKDFVAKLEKSQVVLVVGKTGSGKSTQLGQYLLDAGRGPIVCTQPRKISVYGLSHRVKEEFGDKAAVSPDLMGKGLVFATDKALLLHAVTEDPLLSRWGTVMIDEAHERSLETDVLLATLKKVVAARPKFRLVISSATIDVNLFVRFFPTAQVVTSKGRAFEVEVRNIPRKLVPGGLNDAIVRILKRRDEKQASGHVLVFLPGVKEIQAAERALEKAELSRNCVVLPLHGQVRPADQGRVFEELPEKKRKIILCTNIAETSITIPGVNCVIDSGLVKMMLFRPERGMSVLKECFVSQASAVQRMGRAGRTEPGLCHRLYTEEQFDMFAPHFSAEIKRVDLAHMILRLKLMGENVDTFEFLEPPDGRNLEKAKEQLRILGAVSLASEGASWDFTEFGRFVAKTPLSPALAKIVFEGMKCGCTSSAVQLACLLASGTGVKYYGREKQAKGGAKGGKRVVGLFGSDVDELIAVWEEYMRQDEDKRRVWCRSHAVNLQAMRTVERTVKELTYVHCRGDVDKIGRVRNRSVLRQVLVTALVSNLCVFNGLEYVSVLQDEVVFVHPSSAISSLPDARPKLVLYCSIQKTARTFIQILVPVERSEVLAAAQRQSRELGAKVKALLGREWSFHRVDYDDVGPSLLLTKIVGRRGSSQRRIEKEFSCIIKWDEKSRILSVFGRDPSIRERFGAFMKSAREQLLSENVQEHVIGGTRAAFGEGGVISEVLLATDFNSFSFRLKSSEKDVKERFLTFGKIAEYVIHPVGKTGDRQGVVRYETAECAKSALEDVPKLFGSIHCVRRTQEYPKFGRVLAWAYRAPPIGQTNTGTAFVNFASMADLTAFQQAAQPSLPVVRTDAARVSATVRVGTGWNEPELMSALMGMGFSPKSVVIARQGPKGPSPDPLDMPSVFHRLSKFGTLQSVFAIPSKGSKQLFAVEFKDLPAAIAAAESPALRGGNPGVFVAMNYTATLTCPSRGFSVLEAEFQSAKTFVEKEYGVQVRAKRGRSVVIRISGSDSNSVALVQRYLSPLLSPRSLYVPDQDLLSRKADGRKFLETLERRLQVRFVTSKRTDQVKVFCLPQNLGAVSDELARYVIEHRRTHLRVVVPLDRLGRRVRGILQPLLSAEESLSWRFWRRSRAQKSPSLVLRGPVDLVKSLAAKIPAILKGGESKAASSAKPMTCNVCLDDEMELDESFRLSACGCCCHRACLHGGIMISVRNTEFPMVCPACRTSISIRDLTALLLPAEMQTLQDASFRNFKICNQDTFVNCITPDCRQIVRKLTGADGNPLAATCDCCRVTFCPECSSVPHPGMSCMGYVAHLEAERLRVQQQAEFRAQRAQRRADHQARRVEQRARRHVRRSYLSVAARGIKSCPKCRVKIFKDGGCNHVNCTQCNTHICWRCMRNFSTSDACYAHLSAKHGGCF